MDEFDVLIQNAKIVEGTGREAYKGSIGVAGDRVAAIGDVKGDAKKVVDAKGLTALPGFIDAHSHADWTLLWYPQCESYVMQGVTTFVGGQCGGGPGAPRGGPKGGGRAHPPTTPPPPNPPTPLPLQKKKKKKKRV